MAEKVINTAAMKHLEALNVPGWESAYSRMKEIIEDNLYIGEAYVPAFAVMGNPGVGKSSIARKMAPILYDLGIIDTPRIVKMDPYNLMGQYHDHAEDRMNEFIEKAEGGLLLIDEAHELCADDDSVSEMLLGVVLESVMPLLSTEDGIHTCVVFSGYPEQMEMLFEASDELSERIGEDNMIIIPDTSTDILKDRFFESLKIMKYELSPEIGGEEGIVSLFEKIYETRDKKFYSNYRVARRVAETSCNSARLRGAKLINREDFGIYSQYFN